MAKHILFIQGAGEGAYEEDKKLAASLQHSLGSEYEVHYPAMQNEAEAPYEQLKQQIEKELAAINEPTILVGHSVGASVIIKYVSELKAEQSIISVFLTACPFWGGDGWRYEGYQELSLHSAALPKNTPIVFYHCRDDEVVPFEHLALYASLLPQAQIREIDQGGHQLNNDLSVVAKDIKNLL